MFPPALLTAAAAAGPRNKNGEAAWEGKLKFPVAELRRCCASLICGGVSPAYLSAWAGECGAEEEKGVWIALRTRFDFTAGQQQFVSMAQSLANSVTTDDLAAALFSGWRARAGTSMRWDPEDEKRQYALQAFDPTDAKSNPPRGDPGANLLACHGLTFFPLAADRAASQPGFGGSGPGKLFTWPIWSPPISADAIGSLLARFSAGEGGPPAPGVAAVMCARIVTPSGRYRCFAPARHLVAAKARHAQ
ncbi:MAG: type I-G CRISPR-associated protein, Cas3-extension family, partial [Terriglobales bacterium]